MKIVFNVLSILIIVTIVFLTGLSVLNTQIITDLVVRVSNGYPSVYQINLVRAMLWVFIIGVLIGSLWSATFYSKIQKKLKEYQRKLEKTSINAEDGSSKLSVLESKIAVLEKALQSALENKE